MSQRLTIRILVIGDLEIRVVFFLIEPKELLII